MTPKVVFKTPWFQIATVEPGPEASGTKDPYYCLIRPNGVIGLIFDETGRIVLIEQYRPPLGRSTLEMPAGTIENGESHKDAIAREVLEETGFICEALVYACPCRLMLNRENVVEYFFIGLRARKKPDFVGLENGTVRLLDRRDFLDLIKAHRFEQTVALGALYTVQKIFDIDLLTDDIRSIEEKLTAAR